MCGQRKGFPLSRRSLGIIGQQGDMGHGMTEAESRSSMDCSVLSIQGGCAPR